MDDAVPITSKAGAGITSPSPPRKRKQLSLGHLSLAEKQAILNLYKKSLDDEPTLKTVQLVSKIAMTLGVAKSTVYRAIKQVKNEASKNKTYKLKDVRELLIEALNNVTNMNWKKCVEHVIEEEEKMGTLDGIMNDLIEPLILAVIISINNSESDMDTDSSNNSENC